MENIANIQGTEAGSVTEALPSARSVRGALRKLRDAHGADTVIGHLCSDIMEASENHEKSGDEDQRRHLSASIIRWTDDLDAKLKKLSH